MDMEATGYIRMVPEIEDPWRLVEAKLEAKYKDGNWTAKPGHVIMEIIVDANVVGVGCIPMKGLVRSMGAAEDDDWRYQIHLLTPPKSKWFEGPVFVHSGNTDKSLMAKTLTEAFLDKLKSISERDEFAALVGLDPKIF